MEPGDGFVINTVPMTMSLARRLVSLALKSKRDRIPLAASAIVFLQTTLEHGNDVIAYMTLDENSYSAFARLPLRDRMRVLDQETGAEFFRDPANVFTVSVLDRLVTIRNRIAHAKGADIRSTVMADDRIIDTETGVDISNRTIAQFMWGHWMTKASPEDAKEFQDAVVKYLDHLAPELWDFDQNDPFGSSGASKLTK